MWNRTSAEIKRRYWQNAIPPLSASNANISRALWKARKNCSSLLVPDFFKSSYRGIPETQRVILLGCVDNNKSRKLCHAVFAKQKDLIYIDSGNGEHTGQVVCGVRQNGRTTYKPVCSLYPDILDDEDKFPSELSCAERAVSAPQSVTANLTAATAVVSFLYDLLICGELKTRYVTFSSRQINMRAEMVKPRKRIARPAVKAA